MVFRTFLDTIGNLPVGSKLFMLPPAGAETSGKAGTSEILIESRYPLAFRCDRGTGFQRRHANRHNRQQHEYGKQHC